MALSKEQRKVLFSEPNSDALYIANHILRNKQTPTFAEIGVGIGSTTKKLCELNKNGTIYLFDYDDILQEISETLTEVGFNNIELVPNSRKELDSYAWSIAALSNKKEELFDFVFLDGAHVFSIDAITIVMLKELTKLDGILLLDDYCWTMGNSPTKSPKIYPKTSEQYTDYQINTPHIKMACDLFIENDSRFERFKLPCDKRCAAFKKIKI